MREINIRRALMLRFTRRHLEREIDDELADHLARRTAALIASGMTEDDARREAERRFGDRGRLRDACLEHDLPQWRQARMRDSLEQFLADLRFGVRALRRAPGFAAVTLATLVIGIASVTTIFSFIYSVYWRPLPYRDAARIGGVYELRPNEACCFGSISTASADRIARSAHSFDRLARWQQDGTSLVIGSEARSISMLLVDTGFVALFDLHPQLGRLPSQEEILAGSDVAVIGDRLWRAAFGADSAVVGRHLQLGDIDLRIVGVLPEGFGFPRTTDVVRPISPSALTTETDQTLGLLAHLRPGVTRQAASAELATIAQRIVAERGKRANPIRLTLSPEMLDRRASQAIPAPFVFIAVALILLVVACSNVMNLALVRAGERRGEMAVRSSLGAGRGRLIRQALSEAFVIAGVAGVLGAVSSVALMRALLAHWPNQNMPAWVHFGLDMRILVFTIGITLLVTLLIGLTPAREGTRFDLAQALKIGGDGGAVRSGVGRTARRALAVQLALSMALFVAGGLFVKSYRSIAAVDYGYPAEQSLSLSLFFDRNRYPTSGSQLSTAHAILAAAIPDSSVRAAAVRGDASTVRIGAESDVPFAKRPPAVIPDSRIVPDGDTTRAISEFRIPPRVRHFAVSDDYFNTIGIRALRGRTFSSLDGATSEPVVVISERMANAFWPHVNPIGRTLTRGAKGEPFTVIGVVQSVRDFQGIRGTYVADPRPDTYYSERQVEMWNPTVVARARGTTAALGRALAAATHRADPALVSDTQTLAQDGEARLMTTVFGTVIGMFALAGLTLALIGLYGVVAYGVMQRRREIAVRMVFGATAHDVVSLIVRQSLRFVAIGLGVGVLLAAGFAQAIAGFLFRASPLDPTVYLGAALLFASVTLVACWLPALRAAAVDPMRAIKTD